MGAEFKKSQEEEAPVAGWQTIYCSLALILVALFAMLVSYSTVKGGRMTNFLRGFGQPSDKYNTTLSSDFVTGSLVNTGGNKFDKGREILRPSPDIVKSGDEPVILTMKSLEKYFREAGLDKSVSIERIERGFKAVFESNVLFPSGVAAINKEAYLYLDRMIMAARKTPFSIRVEGHTDNVSINTPEFSSNWELSTARAVSVLRYFLENGGIPAERLAAVGFSQFHPVEPNDTPYGRQKNRRVELYFELQKSNES